MSSATLQGQFWDSAAQDWAELQEPQHRPVWKAMLDAAGVGSGTRFLDAGCGGGGASVLAAQRGARVKGLDASAALIDIARKRVPQGDFRVGDLEATPYDAQAFDATIACLSVQYAADPLAALRELRRVCAAGGLFAISTWGLPEQCEQRVIFQAVRETLPPSPAGGGPFALSMPGALERLVEQAGWQIVCSGEADCPFEYPDVATLWLAQRSSGPVQAALRAASEERLHAAVEQAVQPYRTNTGGVRLANRLRFVTAMT